MTSSDVSALRLPSQAWVPPELLGSRNLTRDENTKQTVAFFGPCTSRRRLLLSPRTSRSIHFCLCGEPIKHHKGQHSPSHSRKWHPNSQLRQLPAKQNPPARPHQSKTPTFLPTTPSAPHYGPAYSTKPSRSLRMKSASHKRAAPSSAEIAASRACSTAYAPVASSMSWRTTRA